MQLAVWTQPYVDLQSPAEIAPLVDRLARGGVNLIFPCVKSEVHFTAGKSLAYFATGLIDAAPLGDVLGGVCERAHEHGMAVHPWLCVMLEGDSRFLRAHPDARCCAFDNLNQSAPLPMACPASEDTKAFALAVAREVVQHYPVDGLHLDFIRYPGLNTCSCPRCREDMRRAIDARPEDIFSSGEARRWWLEHRREQITGLVESISAMAHDAGKDISAAVFCDYPRALDEVGQDWADWCRRGLVDVIVPMNYKAGLAEFMVAAVGHRAVLGDEAIILEGIAKTTETVSLSAGQLARQVEAAVELGCAGACIFAARSLDEDDLAALRSLR